MQKKLFPQDKHICCPYCKSDQLKLLSDKSARSIFRCSTCGLVSAADEIKGRTYADSVVDYFNSQEYQTRKKMWNNSYIKEEKLLNDRFKKRLKVIESFRRTGKILDIGCASGIFLNLALSDNWQVYGVDISKQMVRFAQNKLGRLNVFQGDLREQNFSDNQFDVVVAFDTLEHLPDLTSILHEIRRISKNQGLLAISVPDQAGLVSRVLGKSWFDYKRPEHFYFFSLKTLHKILRDNAFEIIFKDKEIFYDCSIESITTKFKRYYPSILSEIVSNSLPTLAGLIGVKNIPLPLEHIYVVAKKKK